MAIHKPTTYLFVDGSNFRKYFNESTTKWFGQEVEFDFQKIKDFFQAEKAFYYDCIDDVKGDNESQKDFALRVQTQEEKLNKIREVEGCHVHLGSISGKNKKKRQKEVDVMLAVQMMEHAFRGNMQKAVLLSGDKDFRPLVESLVRLGLFVEVVGDRNHISRDLIHSADSSRKLSFIDYHEWTQKNIRETKLINLSNRTPNTTDLTYIKKGKLNEKEIILGLYERVDNNYYIAIRNPPEPDILVGNHNQEYIELYFELLNGKVEWNWFRQ